MSGECEKAAKRFLRWAQFPEGADGRVLLRSVLSLGRLICHAHTPPPLPPLACLFHVYAARLPLPSLCNNPSIITPASPLLRISALVCFTCSVFCPGCVISLLWTASPPSSAAISLSLCLYIYIFFGRSKFDSPCWDYFSLSVSLC